MTICGTCNYTAPRHHHKCKQRPVLAAQPRLWEPMSETDLRILRASLNSGWAKQAVHAGYGTPLYLETLDLLDELSGAERDAVRSAA